MDYCLQENGLLKPFENENTIFKNPNDIRNFAITCIFTDDQDRILRSKNIRHHYYALRTLFEQTKKIREYILSADMIDQCYCEASESFCQHGGGLLSTNAPDSYKRIFNNYLYLPDKLNEYQKNVLQEQYEFLCQEDKVSIFKYDLDRRTFKELNSDPKIYQEILKKELFK